MGLDARHESLGQGRVEHSQRNWPLGGLKRWQVPDPAGPAGCGMDYGF